MTRGRRLALTPPIVRTAVACVHGLPQRGPDDGGDAARFCAYPSCTLRCPRDSADAGDGRDASASAARTLTYVLATLLLAACAGGPAPRPRDAGACDGAPCARACGWVPTTPAGRTLTYVLARITIDMTDDARVPHAGFDVDDRWSLGNGPGDCVHEDFFSSLDPDQNCRVEASVVDRSCPAERRGCLRGSMDCVGGVDNQLATLANTLEFVTGMDVRQMLAAELRAGRALLLVRVEGADDGVDDPEVDITLLLAFDADGDCANNFSGAGRFVVDAASFVDGDVTRPRWRAPGAVVRSRVQTRGPFAGVALLPTARRFSARDVERAQLRFTLSCDAQTISQGNFGGVALARPWVEDVAAELENTSVTREQIETTASGLVDVELEGVCVDRTSTPRRFGGVAVGYGFTGVAATVVGVAPRAPEGACGARDDGGADAGPIDAAPDTSDAADATLTVDAAAD